MNQIIRRIMIVEDDIEIVNIYKLTLELEGYQVTAAFNGKEALQNLTSQPSPNVILLDLMMPIMDGREFLKAKESDLRFRDIPVVLLTASVEQLADVTGINEHLKKPIDVDTLLGVLKNYA